MIGHNESVQPLPFRAAVLHLALLLIIALIVYLPWAPAPFPVLDYSEFLRALRSSDSFGESLANLSTYYRSHGRSSYLAYTQLAANWSLFGERPGGWSVAVFGYMFAALCAVWLLLVRLGNAPVYATVGAALLIVATPAVPGWLRPSGEPLVVLFFCVAIMLSLDYQRATRWQLRAALILFALLGIGLAKDLLSPLAIAPVVIACCWENGFRLPRPSPRNAVLLGGAVAVAIILAALVVSALLGRAPDAYTRAYRANNVTLGGFVSVFWMMLLPYTSSLRTPQLIGDLAFILCIIAGWWLGGREPARPNKLRELNAWLALLFLGALLYTPVAWYTHLYGLPFFLASVALLTRALSRAERVHTRVRMSIFALTAVVLTIGGITAFNEARLELAERRLNGQLAAALRHAHADTMLMALPVVNPWAWAQQSAVLRRYAIERGDLPRPEPAARDVGCNAVPSDSAVHVRILLINFPEKCGPLPNAWREYRQSHWELTPWPTRRELRAQLILLDASASETGRTQ